MKMTHLRDLLDLRRSATLAEGVASFSRIHPDPSYPLPKCEAEVDEFIRRRTDLYLQSWVLPAIDRAIERERERNRKRKGKKRRVGGGGS